MENKFIALAVGLTVGVIMLSGFLWPVVSDATATATTFANEGYYTMDEVTNDTVTTIEWEKANPDTLIVDDVPFDMSFAETNKSYTIIGSDSMILRYLKDTTNRGVMIFSNDPNAAYVSFHTGTAATSGDKVTITLSNNSVTFITDGTTPINKTVADIGDDAYVINPTGTGNYSVVMKKADIPAYVLGDSTIRFMGVSVAGGPGGIALYGIGTLDDGIEISTIYTNNTTTDVSYSDPEPTDTEISGYDSLYSLDKYTFTISYTDNGTPKTFDATYSYFLIPNEVTAEKSWHLDTTQIALVAAIGTLGAIVLIAAAAGSIRRLD